MSSMARKSNESGVVEAVDHGREPFNLEEWPFYWITQTYGVYLSRLEDALRKVELDIPTWRVLMLLEGDRARSTTYLATEAITKLSTMTRIIQRMQADGLVLTRPRATDGRVTEALLTGHGRRARVLAWQTAQEVYKLAFKDISPEQVAAINDGLSVVHRNLLENDK